MVLFPWIRVRKQIMAQTKQQAGGGGKDPAPSGDEATQQRRQQAKAAAESVMAALRRTYEDEGFQALFRGALRQYVCVCVDRSEAE